LEETEEETLGDDSLVEKKAQVEKWGVDRIWRMGLLAN
jgi:hypothetical protein